MNKFPFLLFVSICSIFLVGCNKGEKQDEEMIKPEGRYRVSQVLTVEMPVMYTRNSVITNTQYIKDFLKRDTMVGWSPTAGLDSGFIFNATTQQIDLGIDINFYALDSVRIEYLNHRNVWSFYQNPTTKIYTPFNNNEVILKDTGASIYNEFGDGGNPENRVNMLHKLEKNNTDMLTTSSHSWGIKAFGNFNLTLIHSNNTFYIPIVRFRFSHRSTNFRKISTSDYDNPWIYLNPNITHFQQYIGTNDTIIIQKKRGELVR